MADVRTLHTYPLDEAVVANLKTVKAQMAVEYLIVPKLAQIGTGGRVVAFQPVPWLVTDGIAYVQNAGNASAMADAIAWAVEGYDDKRATTISQQLTKIFGKEVREITREQLAYEGASKHLDLGNEKKVRFGK